MSNLTAPVNRTELDDTLDTIAKGLAYNSRSPVVRNPGDEGLEWEDVYFPSADGTVLEGWFIPSPGSEKLIICTHAFGFNKGGFPSHIEPWKSYWGPGNDYEISFIPDYRILHDAGYNVFAYDFRNHGHSAAANGALNSNNRFEARDVLGSLAYVRSRNDLANMTLGLFSRCMGANATFRAFASDPELFKGVRCLVAPLLLSAHIALKRQLEGAGLDAHFSETESRLHNIIGVTVSDESPHDWAKLMTLPTLTYGVHDDTVTSPADLEGIFSAIATDDKDMFWIEETQSRWDGYMWFQRHPERVLEWFKRHMG